MTEKERNFTVSISSSVRADFVRFCESVGLKKKDVVDKLFSSFLNGRSLTPQELIEKEKERLENLTAYSVSSKDHKPASELCQDS